MKLVIDTSVFIEFLRRKTGPLAILASEKRNDISELIIPTPVIYELWSGQSMQNAQIVKDTEAVFEDFHILELSPAIAKKAGELRRLKLVDGIDAMVAATTLLHGDYLVTLNTKHFNHIPGLKLWDI